MAAAESQAGAARFTHVVVYVCEQQLYGAVALNDMKNNGDLITMDPLRKFKAGFGRGPKRLEVWIQVVTLCMNKKVADKLSFMLSEVVSEKNIPDDYFVTHKILPRTCDIRSVEAVPKWLNSQTESAFESSDKFTGVEVRRSSRNSQRKGQPRKQSADETSANSDSSADNDEPVVDVEPDRCTVAKRTSKRKSFTNVEDEGAQDMTSTEEESYTTSRARTSKKAQAKPAKRRTSGKRTTDSSESEADKRVRSNATVVRSNAAVYSTPNKSTSCRVPRRLISHDTSQVLDPDLQSPTFDYSDAANASSSKRSFNTTMMEHTSTMMQVMLDNTKQLGKDFEEVKKIQRLQAKQLTLLQVAIGRLSSEKRSSTDSHTSVGTASAVATTSARADDQSIIDLESADGLTQSTLDKHVHSPCNAVGSIRWIRATYGLDKAREIVRGLRRLNVPITKWPGIFEGRFAADKLMATRLLKARFSEEELANFCMSRPSQSKALDSCKTQGTSKERKKTVLPDKQLMLDLLALMAFDGYTPQNANIRFQSALTVANRNQRQVAGIKSTSDKTADSDNSITETRVDSLQTQLVNVVIETLQVETTAMDEDAPVQEQSEVRTTGSQVETTSDAVEVPMACSTQAVGAFDPNRTSLLQLVKLPSPLIEEDVDAVYSSESEARFVFD